MYNSSLSNLRPIKGARTLKVKEHNFQILLYLRFLENNNNYLLWSVCKPVKSKGLENKISIQNLTLFGRLQKSGGRGCFHFEDILCFVAWFGAYLYSFPLGIEEKNLQIFWLVSRMYTSQYV